MAKRPAATPKRDERTLHIKRGQKIEFPVAAKHPLARFQRMTPVRSADDVYDFLKLWEKVAEASELPPASPATLVRRLKKENIKVLSLSTSTLRVDSGAVVTLSNPLIQLEFDEIRIAGDVVANGELVLKCTTLTMA
jgi:hypothetical protein